MKRNLWLTIGYVDTLNPGAVVVPYAAKTRGLGIPLGVYSTEERAVAVGECFAAHEDTHKDGGPLFGPRCFTTHAVKLDVGASVRQLGDGISGETLRALGVSWAK